jgi:hypothetical protein
MPHIGPAPAGSAGGPLAVPWPLSPAPPAVIAARFSAMAPVIQTVHLWSWPGIRGHRELLMYFGLHMTGPEQCRNGPVHGMSNTS